MTCAELQLGDGLKQTYFYNDVASENGRRIQAREAVSPNDKTFDQI